MKIKVLRVIARLNIGGPAIHTILLTKSLNPSRFDSLLVTGREGKDEGNMLDLSKEGEVTPVVIQELSREINFKNDLIALLKLYRLIKRERPDIVHTHTAKAGTLGRVAAKLAGVKIIIHTFHGHIFHSYFSPSRSRFFIFIERILSLFTDRIIAVSDTQRREILNYRVAPPKKVVCIPLGLELEQLLDCQRFNLQLKDELEISSDVRLVGIVARLVPIKSHRDLLKAAKVVLQTYPKVRFLLVGDGELRSDLESLSKELGISDKVIFLGWRDDLPKVYADLDLVVLSSLNEGLPVAIIEAMAAGKPVVATKVGGVMDLVSDGISGILVPPNDPSALAQSIISLLNDPQRLQQMGREGRRRVFPQFSSQRLLKDIESLYEDLLEEKGVSR